MRTVVSRRTLAPGQRTQPTAGHRFDWAVSILSSIAVGGGYLDGWAHTHFPELETFFTPWHAILYAGYGLVAGLLLATFIHNLVQGYPWPRAMPIGYELSLLGVLLFALGGLGDMIWHILFGIETGVDSLYSPTHLLLALGGG